MSYEHELGVIEERLKEIYDDLADNVTHIYGRQDLHLALDLVYHSPLRINFDGELVKKGYPELLVIGDTRTGKTQCAEALKSHYNLGVSAGGESCSFAGLVGGLQQVSANWTCTWGLLPQNNRRLVIIDEASGISKEEIAKMSEVRSQGRARITKIQTQETESWTRMIWLSNPREQLTVNQFSSGVDIIESLIPTPEDIARWDFAIIVSKDEIEFKRMSTRGRRKVTHTHTQELCRNLVLWSWTREPKEIFMSQEAEDQCFKRAEDMLGKYCTDFTLVNAPEQAKKLARLSTSLAARLFTTTTGKDLLVHPWHVEYIYQYLCRLYNSRYFKYDTWSINQTKGTKIIDPAEIAKFCTEITPQGCGKFADMKQIRCRDIEELLGISTDQAKSMLSRLYLNNALARSRGDYYYKSPEFQNILCKYSTLPDQPIRKEF